MYALSIIAGNSALHPQIWVYKLVFKTPTEQILAHSQESSKALNCIWIQKLRHQVCITTFNWVTYGMASQHSCQNGRVYSAFMFRRFLLPEHYERKKIIERGGIWHLIEYNETLTNVTIDDVKLIKKVVTDQSLCHWITKCHQLSMIENSSITMILHLRWATKICIFCSARGICSVCRPTSE